MGRERILCGECIFKPELVGLESEGMHELVYNAAELCAGDMRKELLNNIILSGGSTMFPGISDRLARDIHLLNP